MANQKNWDWHIANNVFRIAAHHHASDAASAVSAHHNEVRILIFGLLYNIRARLVA